MTLAVKQLLRQQIRHILKLMSNEDRVYQSNIVTNILLHHPKYISSRSISIYVHMNTEISTRAIIQHAFQVNKHVFIPRYDSKTMDMVRIYSLDDLDSLPITKWNIQQPSLDDTNREIATNDIDLVIVPGLCFSLDGSRIGHGKGFYDRYLSTLNEHSYTIGLAFCQQIVENNVIPMNSNDVRINEILVSKKDK
jgi:5-formyltetrahydrofolate cyclo-ligase